MPALAEQLDPRQPLKKLADKLPWEEFEKAFGEHYSATGRPAKPVRLMVGLLLLKHLENLSDESVVDRWVRDPYYQYFCGMEEFQWELPCDPSDLVYFRRRIGEEGVSLIFTVSARMHEKELTEPEVIVDTTVQEKDITFPTDTKLYRKIIQYCWKIADSHEVKLRRRYGKEVRNHLMAQRWRKTKEKRKLALKGQRRLRTIAGALIRELERKLPHEIRDAYLEAFKLYRRVLNQKPRDKNKIYSLHEPGVYCIAKGKEHKKYEFGCKASIAMTKDSGIIVSAVAHKTNQFDGHTLPEVLELADAIMGQTPKKAIVDRGYRGRKKVGETEILCPQRGNAEQSRSQKTKMRKRFRRRAAIEPVISHLKHDFRMARCYLKGHVGDSMNVKLAAAAWNLRKWMRFLFAQIRTPEWPAWVDYEILIWAKRRIVGSSRVGILLKETSS